jgi:hypothetical protein
MTDSVQNGAAKNPQYINKEGCSTTRGIQKIGLRNIEK